MRLLWQMSIFVISYIKAEVRYSSMYTTDVQRKHCVYSIYIMYYIIILMIFLENIITRDNNNIKRGKREH